jgi:hypothetical protein
MYIEIDAPALGQMRGRPQAAEGYGVCDYLQFFLMMMMAHQVLRRDSNPAGSSQAREAPAYHQLDNLKRDGSVPIQPVQSHSGDVLYNQLDQSARTPSGSRMNVIPPCSLTVSYACSTASDLFPGQQAEQPAQYGRLQISPIWLKLHRGRAVKLRDHDQRARFRSGYDTQHVTHEPHLYAVAPSSNYDSVDECLLLLRLPSS